ncbi:MAG: hypothetical protein KDK27_09475, partial [Leptospiraceae bacterium]|nr:hypothetical protein [Leptospiraceae bacterium]
MRIFNRIILFILSGMTLGCNTINTDCATYDGQCNLLLTYLLYNPVYELRDCELLASDSYATWYTLLGSSDDDFVSDICGGRDRLFVTGSTNGIVSSAQGVTPISGYPTSPPESKIMVASYGSGGNMNWFRIMGPAGSGQGSTAIAATGDGGAVLLGNTAVDIPSIDGVTPLQSFQGSGEFIIIRFDKNGFVQWYTFFGGTGNDQPRDLIATSDGGVLVCGTTSTNIPGYAGLSPLLPFSNNDAVIVKFASNGTPEWYT